MHPQPIKDQRARPRWEVALNHAGLNLESGLVFPVNGVEMRHESPRDDFLQRVRALGYDLSRLAFPQQAAGR